jgi:hypothetical protein
MRGLNRPNPKQKGGKLLKGAKSRRYKVQANNTGYVPNLHMLCVFNPQISQIAQIPMKTR